MFNIDRWQEIFDTLWRNKLRSLLTAFSMAWGIFMLVLLLGLGNGLSNGVERGFADDATNSVWIFSGTTTLPYQGMPLGRRLVMANRDIDRARALPEVEHLTGRFSISSATGVEPKVRIGNKVSSFEVRSVHPDHLHLERTVMKFGRYINDADIRDRAKVAVIGIEVAKFLFEREAPSAAVGRWLQIGGVPYQVIGVFTDEGGEDENAKIFLPISTAQAAYSGGDKVHTLMFTVGEATPEQTEEILAKVKTQLSESHKFDPEDKQALRIRNNVEGFARFQAIFSMISWFVWIMGLGTIIAGVVGISNIMMIVVRERTKEIGIRKALGAHPRHIIGSVVQEAVALTAAAGYLGLCGGVGALAFIGWMLSGSEMFADPSIDLRVAMVATLVLMIAGTLAGLFPALAAAKVNPIVALRDE